MKYSAVVLATIATFGGASAFTPQMMASTMRHSSTLSAEAQAPKDRNINWGAALAPVVAGLVFASQASFAAEPSCMFAGFT